MFELRSPADCARDANPLEDMSLPPVAYAKDVLVAIYLTCWGVEHVWEDGDREDLLGWIECVGSRFCSWKRCGKAWCAVAYLVRFGVSVEDVLHKLSWKWDVQTGNATRYVYRLIYEVPFCNAG